MPNFEALPYVKSEVAKIGTTLPSRVLLDQQFNRAAFQTAVESAPFSIVHLATHGRFSSQAEQTYILAWDGKISVNQLSSILQTVELMQIDAIELLVLSACETAAGDDRAALGLAGVAVRSGARSTVAKLWRVNDAVSATLMEQFYDQLAQLNQTKISKAEALRRAQLAILHNPRYEQEPYFWAAYVLIGNWT